MLFSRISFCSGCGPVPSFGSTIETVMVKVAEGAGTFDPCPRIVAPAD